MATSRAPTRSSSTYTKGPEVRRLPATPAPPSGAAVYSAESGRTYNLTRLIGKGGFGEVYLATPVPADVYPAQVCVKISDRLAAWLREAYFAELLAREQRALRVFDRFVEVRDGQTRYCLAMEYAEYGDLGSWLGQKGPQPERFVRREIAAILHTLDALHGGHAMHRDLTPFNVFVCGGEQLKLGDFGIAAHQRNSRGVTADAFNLFHVPNEIAWGKVRRWQKRDDVYQIGLLAAMLLRGDIAKPMHSKDVRGLPCSDHLKEVIHRCLGSRGKRYEAADDLIAALKQRPAEQRFGRVKSLAGKRVSFTGFLVRPRAEAIVAAKRAGAVVQSKPGVSTDILVRGKPNALQIAGKDGGSKLIEVRRLAARGVKVTVIDERQFWRLAQSGTQRRQRELRDRKARR